METVTTKEFYHQASQTKIILEHWFNNQEEIIGYALTVAKGGFLKKTKDTVFGNYVAASEAFKNEVLNYL